MKQLQGFMVASKESFMCKLKKSLYTLKQDPRQWYKKVDSFMSNNSFRRCQVDHCCYIKKFNNSFIILLFSVDDMLISGFDMKEINNLKRELSKQFAIKDLGATRLILIMRISRDIVVGTLTLSQVEYINKVFSKFNM